MVMPNWCNNTLNLRHADPAMIERAKTAFADGRFLDEFIPVPEALKITAGFLGDADEQKKLEEQQEINRKTHGYTNWYEFCIGTWGTKWDVGGSDGYVVEQDANGVVFNFDSAWAPPTGAYEHLMEQGFEIIAYYYEPGMAFAGKWENGDDDYYEYGGMTSDQIADELPDDLDETFGISESVAEYEAEQEEEDYDE
jgi:hypothetical protein